MSDSGSCLFAEQFPIVIDVHLNVRLQHGGPRNQEYADLWDPWVAVWRYFQHLDPPEQDRHKHLTGMLTLVMHVCLHIPSVKRLIVDGYTLQRQTFFLNFYEGLWFSDDKNFIYNILGFLSNVFIIIFCRSFDTDNIILGNVKKGICWEDDFLLNLSWRYQIRRTFSLDNDHKS